MVDMKLILLGNTGVGKSSLIRRFLDDVFTESLSSTVSFAFNNFVKDKSLVLLKFGKLAKN